MEVDTDDEVLNVLAAGGRMNYDEWPAIFPRLLPRLEKIVYEDFPPPKHPQVPIISSSQATEDPSTPPKVSPSASDKDRDSQSSTQSTNKENAPPSQPETTTSITANASVTNVNTKFPPYIQSLWDGILHTLKALFSKHPPHTIQRLAELLLHPKKHYRSLPAYLHALDRVVHVTSGAHVFPLPPAIPDPSAAAVLSNGTLPSGADPLSISWGNPATAGSVSAMGGGLGSDESLGGALLTPISWLTTPTKAANGTHSPLEGEVKTESTEMVDGPNGPGGVETVSISLNGVTSARSSDSIKDSTAALADTTASLRAEGGVTQGELLRQEQKAGVVPLTQLQSHRGTGDAHGLGEDDEMPHARGPEEIGMEDTGPQKAGGTSVHRVALGVDLQGIDVAAAVGRKADGDDVDSEDEKEVKDEEGGDEEMKDVAVTPKREAEEGLEKGEEKKVKEEPGTDADEKSKDDATAS